MKYELSIVTSDNSSAIDDRSRGMEIAALLRKIADNLDLVAVFSTGGKFMDNGTRIDFLLSIKELSVDDTIKARMSAQFRADIEHDLLDGMEWEPPTDPVHGEQEL